MRNRPHAARVRPVEADVATPPRPGSPAIWIAASRPKTLLLSIAPVVAGTALALFETGDASLLVFVLAFAAAAAIQIGTNLWNDACDGVNGTDDDDRLGPQRVTAAGLIAPEQVRRAAIAMFLLAVPSGAGLVVIGGWPILLIGLLSLTFGVLYSAGPWPISASPIGEILVFFFFGLVAVAGTYFLHTGAVTVDAVLFGTVVGLPATAVLLINNHRDRDGDKRNGRRTLAITIGETATRVLFGLILATALASAAVLARPDCLGGWLTFVPAAAASALLTAEVAKLPVSRRLNATLARTAGLQALLVATVICAWLVCSPG